MPEKKGAGITATGEGNFSLFNPVFDDGRGALPLERLCRNVGKGPSFPRKRESVRLGAGAIRGVKVPSPGDARSWVAKGNCVAARRGGEQPEANMQSVG
jgi:hypothetical protein